MVWSPQLTAKVEALASTLGEAKILYAVGGAIALGYYGEPRATIDIDVNVFVLEEEASGVLGLLEPLGFDAITPEVLKRAATTGQVRLEWDGTLVDLFFVNHDFHRECLRHIREVPFGSMTIWILGCEDLMVFKMAFNRRKDWLDIEQLLFVREIDLAYLRRWMRAFFGSDDERIVTFEKAVNDILGPDA